MKIVLFKDIKLQLTSPVAPRNDKDFYQNVKLIKAGDLLKWSDNSDLLDESECNDLINLLKLKPIDATPKVSSESAYTSNFEKFVCSGPDGKRFKPSLETDSKLNIMIYKGPEYEVKHHSTDEAISKPKMTFRIEGSLLDRIVHVFTEKFGCEVLFELTVSKFLHRYLEERDKETRQSNSFKMLNKSYMVNLQNYLAFKTKEMKIVTAGTSKTSPVAYCEDEVILPRAAHHSWVVKKHPVVACFTLAVILKDHEKMLRQQVEVTRKIVERGTGSDVTIIAGDGTEFKCHKAFLLVHDIPAFRAMLEGDFQESKNSVIKMNDMNSEGVQAFLDYLYFYRVDFTFKTYETAFELLYTAEKYDLQKLKDAMIDMMVNKEDDWYTFHNALEVFVFSMNIQTRVHELKRKAAKVMKTKIQNLGPSDSGNLKEILKTHAEAGLEIMQYFAWV